MTDHESLHFQSLSSICRQLKSGALSSVTLTQYMFERIHKLTGQTLSFARLLEEQALATAAARDEARAQGQPLGALHGVPIAIKDLLYTKDIATASGTIVMQDFHPTFDATVVTLLEQAGAVIIGKTQLTEGAFGHHHPDIPAPINPWDKRAWSGVSSSGSGVSVAAGLAFAALGSDTGGSIRFPSASCGLVGLKPTYGRVSLHGAFPLAGSLDHIGPMTRSVEDAARMLSVMAGYDENDAGSVDTKVPDYLSQIVASNSADLDFSDTRIGVDWDYVSNGVEPEVSQVIRDTIDALSKLGAEICPVVMPESYKILAAGWVVTTGVECAKAHREFYPQQKAKYGPDLAALIELGLRTTAEDYALLEHVRRDFTEQMEQILEQVDVMISPCMPIATPDIEVMSELSPEEGQADFLTFTAPFDYSGHPTLTLPSALNASGRPASFQLVAVKMGEANLLKVGSMIEQSLPRLSYPELDQTSA
ncbi:MAG: amidase [Candidatus Azotimanducaceae bacterium]|jgi:amidase|tara:strand:+ start:7025 stop:8458 length:1434 start_codon:yes stop_codon:yes gene_type:complete